MVLRYTLLSLSFLVLQSSVMQAADDEEETVTATLDGDENSNRFWTSGTDSIAPEQEACLLMPLAYYRGVARRLFTLDADSTECSAAMFDKTLLDIYIRRPDLVKVKGHDLQAEALPVDAKPVLVSPPIGKIERNMVPDDDMVVAQEPKLVILRPNFWSFKGDYYLQFLQNYVSANWYKGGEKNYSVMASATLEANFNNKQKVRWDNKLEIKVGAQTSQSDTVHKVKINTDLLRLTSRLGLQATKKWYYTIQLVANTQMFRGFSGNSNYVQSDFLSPLTTNLSIGMDYKASFFKNRLTGNVHLAPLAYNLKYVDRKYLNTRYGIKTKHHAMDDFGSQSTIDLTWEICNNVKWRSRLYGYTTYKRSEMEWENTFSFQFNKYISSMLYVYPRFDDSKSKDSDYGYFQLKEYISFGFSYSM